MQSKVSAERRLLDELAKARREAEDRLSAAAAERRAAEAALQERLAAATSSLENAKNPAGSADMAKELAAVEADCTARLKLAAAAADATLATVKRDAAAALVAEQTAARERLEKALADASIAATAKVAADLRQIKEGHAKVRESCVSYLCLYASVATCFNCFNAFIVIVRLHCTLLNRNSSNVKPELPPRNEKPSLMLQRCMIKCWKQNVK